MDRLHLFEVLPMVKRLYARQYMQIWMAAALIVHFSLILLLPSFAPTGSVAFRSAPPKHLANVVCMKGAQVKFAYKTTPCVSSRRYLLNLWPVSQKSSDAAAVLKDNAETACLEGQTGSLIIELQEPIILQRLSLRFNSNSKGSSPKSVVIYGSADADQTYRSLMEVTLKEKSVYEQIDLGKDIAPIKFLKIAVLSNWGAKVTTIEYIEVAGEKFTKA